MKKIVVVLMVSLSLFSCNQGKPNQEAMFNSFKKTDTIQTFWKWFVNNKQKFEQLENETVEQRDEKLNLVLNQLHKIKPGLSLEISKRNNKGVRELTISAEGDIDKFAIVKEIVAKAQVIEGWQPIAFRQPTAADFTLKILDLELTPSKLYFVPYVEKDSLDVVIYGEGFKNHDYDSLGHYGLIMLDNLMGEYNAVIKVRHYDFQDLEEVEDTTDLRPLAEINTFLEEFYQNKN